jgi:hypothetical protein
LDRTAVLDLESLLDDLFHIGEHFVRDGQGEHILGDFPTAVLVNKHTAAAAWSELFSGKIFVEPCHRAVLGKGDAAPHGTKLPAGAFGEVRLGPGPELVACPPFGGVGAQKHRIGREVVEVAFLIGRRRGLVPIVEHGIDAGPRRRIVRAQEHDDESPDQRPKPCRHHRTSQRRSSKKSLRPYIGHRRAPRGCRLPALAPGRRTLRRGHAIHDSKVSPARVPSANIPGTFRWHAVV